MVTLFQSGLVVFVPFITGISLDDAFDLVDLAGQSSGWDKFWELSVDEVDWDAEFVGHGLKPDCFVGLQKLRVYNNSGLPDEVSGV